MAAAEMYSPGHSPFTSINSHCAPSRTTAEFPHHHHHHPASPILDPLLTSILHTIPVSPLHLYCHVDSWRFVGHILSLLLPHISFSSTSILDILLDPLILT